MITVHPPSGRWEGESRKEKGKWKYMN